MPKFEVKMREVNENAMPQLDLKMSQFDKSMPTCLKNDSMI